MRIVFFLCSLCIGLAHGAGAEEESVPPTVAEHVRVSRPGAKSVKRVPRHDVGPYQAYEVGRDSAGPGDPGWSLLYTKDGKPLDKGRGDWSDFLGAAPPEQVAKALAHPLDTLLHPSDPQAQNRYHPLHRLPEAMRGQVVDPQRLPDGSLAFFVLDGQGDPPSGVVYRVVVTSVPSGGLNYTREAVRPSTP